WASVAILFGVIGFIVARFGEQDAGHAYENFLLVIGYWITPYLGVVFTDYALRRGRFDVARLYHPTGGRSRGLIPMLAGIGISIPFWNRGLWAGPIAMAFPYLGDLSFIVGFVVAAVVYYGLARGKLAAAAS